MTLSILTMMLVIGFGSAAVAFTPASFSQTIEQGSSATLSFQIQENGYQNLTGITFNTPITFTLGVNTFTSATSISGAITTLTQNTTSSTMSILINVPEYQSPGIYTGTLTLSDQTYNLTIHDIPITITVTPKPRPQDINDCLATQNLGENLRISIEDISTISGFGDDENYWYPLDNVEVKVNIENRGNDGIRNIKLEWGLYSSSKGKFVMDGQESKFNLNDGDEKVVPIDFKLDNPRDFRDGGDYVLYVWATGEDKEFDRNKTCEVTNQAIDVFVDDNLVLDSMKINDIDLEDGIYQDKLSCGSTLTFTADLWNIGDSDQEDITIRVYNTKLGIDEEFNIGKIRSFDKEPISFEFTLPKELDEDGWNDLKFEILEDGDVFQNYIDGDDVDAVFDALLNLENCLLPEATISASLDTGGKAGKPMLIRTTITNTGKEATTYLVNAYGYSGWASTANVEPSTITLQPGQSSDVLITLEVNRQASGDKLFNIEVLSQGQLVMSQPLSVNIEKALISSFFENKNLLLTILVIGIALILIIIIIVLAIRLARK